MRALGLAVRPLRDLGECRVELEAAPQEPGQADRQRVVRYNTSRGFGSIAYRMRAHTLRPRLETRAADGRDARGVVVTRGSPATPPQAHHQATLRLDAPDGAEVSSRAAPADGPR